MALTQISTGGIKDSNVTTADIADQAVSLDKLPHGTSSNNGKFLRANNGADPTFEIVNTDLVADTSPQLGGELDSNGNDIKLTDGEKLKLHNYGYITTKTGATNAVVSGLTGYVLQNSTVIDGNSADIWLSSTSGKKITFGTSDSLTHEVMRVQCAAVGASQHGYVDLNYVVANAGGSASSANRLKTTETGITLTGDIVPATNSAHDLGSNSKKWSQVHADYYYGDGSALTALNGSQIGSGTIPVARIGTGTKNTSTFYRGDGTFATVTAPAITAINSASNNRIVTSDGGTTVTAEESLSFEKVNGADPTFTFKRTSSASGNDNIYAEIRAQNDQGTTMGQLIWRRESSAGNSYLDFETKMDGENSQPSMRIKGQQGTAYFVGNLGRTNDNQPAYMSDTDYYSNTHLSTVNIQTRTNGGECGLFVRGRGQGGGSSSPHSCIRVDATSCANNADQYGIYIKGRQQLVSDTTGIFADVYGSYSTTYVYRAHLQKQVGAYTTGTSFHSKITQTSSGGSSYHMRGYDGSTEKIQIRQGGNILNANNTYGSLSDVKLKENIVDANSQWNDIKALKVRNFNFKDDPDKVKMLGLVAQEAEAVSAGLVETQNDIEVDEKTGEGKPVGTTKYLKYSILYMKAIKALQEAMARIEVLEAKVA